MTTGYRPTRSFFKVPIQRRSGYMEGIARSASRSSTMSWTVMFSAFNRPGRDRPVPRLLQKYESVPGWEQVGSRWHIVDFETGSAAEEDDRSARSGGGVVKGKAVSRNGTFVSRACRDGQRHPDRESHSAGL